MNFLIALLILIAYVVIHAHKAKLSPLAWVKSNIMTTAVAAVVVIGVALIPKPMLEAVAAWYVTPLLVALALKWGAVSIISNAFTVVSAWVKDLLK